MNRQFVVGLGRLGISKVGTLDSLGHEVLAIDKSEDVIQGLADDLPNVHLVAADAKEEDTVRGLNVEGFDAAAVKPKGGPGSLHQGDTVLHKGDVLVGGGSKKALEKYPLVQPDG
ncbi:MAG: NAD-binding protein [Rubrobacter sp.]